MKAVVGLCLGEACRSAACGANRTPLKHALTTAVVLFAHGLALAALTGADTVQPPLLQSAPPIYGELVAAPMPSPQVAADARVPTPDTADAEPEPPLAPEPPVATPLAPARDPQPDLPTDRQSPPQDRPADTTALAPAHADNAAERASRATVIPPRVDARGRNNPPPVYPASSRRAGEQGTVVLAIHINEAGRVTRAQVAQSSGYPRLDRAALEAVRHWRYQPARRGGQPIGFDYRQPVVFALDAGA